MVKCSEITKSALSRSTETAQLMSLLSATHNRLPNLPLKLNEWVLKVLNRLWLCSHGLESRSERRFGTWSGPSLILAHVNAKLFQIRRLKRVLKREKKGVLDRDPPRKPDSRTCECKALSERDSCVCILKMRAEAMHKRMGQSACADCAVGAKYQLSLAVRRSWSWLGRRLQCMWTHVVQITERDSSPCEHSLCVVSGVYTMFHFSDFFLKQYLRFHHIFLLSDTNNSLCLHTCLIRGTIQGGPEKMEQSIQSIFRTLL